MNLDKNLDELENKVWGEPGLSSSLVVECHRLRKVPIKDFSPADLRVMIGQNIGLNFLVPLAIEILKQNPLVEAYYYEGDLLTTVLESDADFWKRNKEMYLQIVDIVNRIDRFEFADKLTKESWEKFKAYGIRQLTFLAYPM